MKKISIWAKYNPQKTKIFIGLLKILNAIIALYVANLLKDSGVILSPDIFYGTLLVFIIGARVYPNKNKNTDPPKTFFYKQKARAFIAGFSSFVIICSLANTNDLPAIIRVNSARAIVNRSEVFSINKRPKAKEILASLQNKDKNSLSAKERRVLKRELKKQLVWYAKAPQAVDKQSAGTTLKIILAIAAAIASTLVVSFLGFALAYGGAEVWAVIVVIAGLTGVIWGLIAWIKTIKKSAERKKNNKSLPEEPSPQPVIQ